MTAGPGPSPRPVARRRLGALLVGGAVALLGACSSEPEGQDEPGAVVLARNIPHDLHDHQVVAFNMDDEQGVISIGDPERGPAERTTVRVGDTVTVGEVEYEVRSVSGDADTGRGLDGAVVLVPAGGAPGGAS